MGGRPGWESGRGGLLGGGTKSSSPNPRYHAFISMGLIAPVGKDDKMSSAGSAPTWSDCTITELPTISRAAAYRDPNAVGAKSCSDDNDRAD